MQSHLIRVWVSDAVLGLDLKWLPDLLHGVEADLATVEAVVGPVWSLTQIFWELFLQSRVIVKKRDFYKHTMQVCDYSSWRWFGTSVPIETHMTRLCIYKSEVEGTLIRRVSSKRPSRVRDRDNIVDEKDCKWTCHPLRGYWFAFQANQWFSKS